jgi:RsiW-degrading membrane proteinase PrsW (M82 family)
VETFYLVTLALLPGIAVAVYLYLHDKHEPEPIWLVAISFVYGMISLLVNLVIAIPIDSIIPIDEHDLTNQAIHAFGVVAFLEELSKFIFVRGILYEIKISTNRWMVSFMLSWSAWVLPQPKISFTYGTEGWTQPLSGCFRPSLPTLYLRY